MSFNAALTGGQLTKLRSSSHADDWQVTFCANTVVFAGQVNSDLTTPQTWASFAYNNVTVGAYTDVVVDQVLLIGTANDITKASFRGRIRATPTNAIIYCNESSQDFVAGAYFWVINSFDIINKLSRPDNNGDELIDYDLPYAGLLPMVTGLRTAYCGWVDSGTGKYRIAFSVAAYACEYGATISSYAFTFKAASYTVISGSLATNAVTVDFNPGEQWGKLVVTDSGGRTLTRHFYIKAHDASNLPDSGASAVNVQSDLAQGWTMDYPAFTGVDSLLNNTFAVVWLDNENYGGVAGALDTTNNIMFIGWLQSEADSALGDPNYAVLSEARLHFTGVMARLNRLVGQWLGFTINASPSAWGQINHLTPWRSICHFVSRYTTAANLCDWDFSNKDDTYLFPAFSTQSSSALQAVQTIAAQINANVEFAPWGAVRVDHDAGYAGTTERAGLTTVVAYSAQDILSSGGGGGGITKTIEPNRNVGKVDADGIVYNATNGQYTPFTARGPGHAQGEGVGSDTLSSQVLAATSDMIAALNELRQRVGNRYEIANMTEVLTVDHPDGYHYLIPSRAQVFTWALDTTLAGANGVSRIVYDTSIFWVLEAVNYSHTSDGVTNVKATYRRLTTVGDPGDNTTTVAPGEESPSVPDIGYPAFPDEYPEIYIPEAGWPVDKVPITYQNPPTGQALWSNGQELIVASSTQAWLLRNVLTKTVPDATEITPADLSPYANRSVLVDPQSAANQVGAYLLAYDSIGAQSAVWYNPNALIPVPDWTKGASFAGSATVLRGTMTAGAILAYSPTTPSGTTADILVTFDPGGYGGYSITSGSYSATGGNPDGCATQTSTDAYFPVVKVDIGAGTVHNVSFDALTGGYTATYRIRLLDSGSSEIAHYDNLTAHGGWLTISVTGLSTSGVQYIEVSVFKGGFTPAQQWIDNIAVNYEPTGSAANVRYSSDHGATWTAAIPLPSSPGSLGGFDVAKASGVSYAAYNNGVARADSLGGAFNAYYAITGGAQAVCIIVPYFNWAGTVQTAATYPDIIVGLDQADGSSRTLLWIEGGATPGTVHDITPVASFVFSHPDAVTVRFHNMIAAWGAVSGTQKVYATVNQGGAWTLRGTISSTGKIRCRRNDNRPSPNGQIYLMQANVLDFSSKWLTALNPRTLPTTGILMFDTIF